MTNVLASNSSTLAEVAEERHSTKLKQQKSLIDFWLKILNTDEKGQRELEL
jgi:hypothetical protein